MSAHGILHAGGNAYFFLPTGNDIRLLEVRAAQVADGGETEIDIGDGLAIEVNHFSRAEHYGCAQIGNAAVGQGFDDQFGTDTVDIAQRKADDRFMGRSIAHR